MVFAKYDTQTNIDYPTTSHMMALTSASLQQVCCVSYFANTTQGHLAVTDDIIHCVSGL